MSDIMVLAGALAVSAGLALAWPPLGLVSAGAFLIAGGLLIARIKADAAAARQQTRE